MIKKNNRYSYATGTRYMDHGQRRYDVAGYRLPSVTTILGRTKDDTFLKDWIKKKGKAEAERIKIASATRGTSMHKYLENYVLGKGYEDMTQMGQLSKNMAQKVIDIGLAPVDGYYGSEVTLYYPGLYAGSTDLVGLHDGKESIIDFKQSNRPKRREWIDDYFMQLGAYAMAHNCVYDTEITQGVILMCTPDNFFQRFIVNGGEFREWKWEWLRRVDTYYGRNVAKS